MRYSKTGILTLFFVLLSGVLSVHAQVQLQRISAVERPNEQGLVVRYHLTQLPDSFRVSQKSLNSVEMVLFSMDLNTDHGIPVSVTPQMVEIELYNLLSGLGTDIYFAEDIYFIADAYPDVNGRDILLYLQYAEREEVLSMMETEEPGTAEPPDDIDLVDTRPDEEEPDPQETPPGTEAGPRYHPWDFYFGIRAGASSSNVNKSDVSAASRSGVVLGIDIGAALPLHLPYGLKPGIETGFYYTERGFKNPSPSILDGELFEFDYLEIPLLGKVSYAVNERISPFLVAGPSVNFMVNAELVEEDDSRIDLDDYTRAIDFSGIFGIGLDINAVGTSINLQLRNNFGYSNVFTSSPADPGNGDVETDPVRFRHNYISVVLGFRF